MNEIKVSFDYQKLQSKPSSTKVSILCNRIAKSIKNLNLDEIKKFALSVGCEGHTFCPATFKNGIKKKENFVQQQLIALDFDNKDSHKKISFEEIKDRADFYELPVLFAYDTLSSTDHDKFRVVFLNDISITDIEVAKAVQLAMGGIFPEADASCYKDVSKMYYGGKKMIYYDDNIPTINIESIFRNYTYCLKEKYKANHYKKKISNFSKETGIALNKNGMLDVTVTYDPTEALGANKKIKNGKNSPTTIIYNFNQANIIANGEIFPNKYYCINFDRVNECTNESSVVKTVERKQLRNHSSYRSTVLTDIVKKCKLFEEFETGMRRLSHEEQFGLATNLIHVETGLMKFIEIRKDNSDFYEIKKTNKWKDDLKYMKQNNYIPQQCDSYCPYYKDCIHGKNILSTVHPKHGRMEKIVGYNEQFYPLEDVQDDTYKAISRAYHADGEQFQIIKSMTGAGKSTSYLKLMEENFMERFLIAAPTNLLKDEIYFKAKKMGINVRKTPSLEQIKDEIPKKVWSNIQRLYRSGKHNEVHPYIYKTLEEKDIRCLKKYMKEREELKKFEGSVITTHRYLLNMDEKRLKEYDAIIIDEDIIFKSLISNQGEITVSELKKLSLETTDSRLAKKINKLLKKAETQTCIELDSFNWDDEMDDNDKTMSFDIPSFCQTRRFYLRRKSMEDKLNEDTISFLKPAKFKAKKYIIVSATVDENICQKYFGAANVKFYECKRAEYKGRLNQYPQKSMSRTCVANNPGIIHKLMKQFNIGEDRVITFMRENIGYLHFGNTEGSNTLEGKDIIVAGTPYHAEFMYKLVAFSMGLDFDEDEKMNAQTVVHNGYRFFFTTFKNEDLRSVHFWMIESELEQAVGRARLLRNICNVHLFSNFPLAQSKMVDNFNYEEN